MASIMVSHPFSKLPEAVRHRVWQYVGSVPRVVEIHEEHGQGPLPHNKEDKSAERDRWYTYVMSRTRPPALLHICKESRALGLNEIYQIAYLDYQNPANKFRLLDEDVSNVEVPAVKQTPAALLIRCKNWKEKKEPLDATRILAVDIMALNFLRQPCADYKFRSGFAPIPGANLRDRGRLVAWNRAPQFPGLRRIMFESARDIVECTKRGLKKLMIIVGNDDDLAEVNLIPVQVSLAKETWRFKQARLAVEDLRTSLHQMFQE
ncbi:hypothetical protein BDZ45DRAFT_739535 [Acephala macrosclerotiorum]|nr:hypothetical protein BDZ45DRAFT_739535 [Acephala macrosclerotiorum]